MPTTSPPGEPGPAAPEALIGALGQVRDLLAGVSYPLALPAPDPAALQVEARAVRAQIDEYLIPRVSHPHAPLLVVIGGPTGAGKSTLVNSLLHRVVSPAGALRPTTRSPVVVCHPDDAWWFDERVLLPTIPRHPSSAGAEPAPGVLRVHPHPRLPGGLALLDAPDLNSVVTANRELAGRLAVAADLWVFVTSAARYADAVPWEALDEARARRARLAVVVDRAPDGQEELLSAQMSGLLAARGLPDVPVLVVPESPRQPDGLLPGPAVAPVQGWLSALTGDAPAREAVVRAGLTGALGALRPRLATLTTGLSAQEDALAGLAGLVRTAYGQALVEVARALDAGEVLTGEALVRWHELIVTGRLMVGLGRPVRGRRRLLGARRPPAAGLETAVEQGLAALLTEVAGAAEERVRRSWASTPAGAGLPADGWVRPEPTERAASARTVARLWQVGLTDVVARAAAASLVSGPGGGAASGRPAEQRRRWARARRAARPGGAVTVAGGYGPAGLALVAMVAALAGDAPRTAPLEPGGGVVPGDLLLGALAGDPAMRAATSAARADLLARADAFLLGDADRVRQVLPDLPVSSVALRRAADGLEAALVATRIAVSPPSGGSP